MAQHSLAHSMAYSAMEKIIGTALSMDPVARRRIEALNGKVISLQTHSPELDVLLLINSNGINLFSPEADTGDKDEHAISYDASIESPSLELIKQLIKSQDPSHLLGDTNSELIISGDTLLVQQCRAIFRELDIDWEESLAHVIGDIAAHQVGRQTRGMLRWAKKSATTLKQDTKEYLQYETKALISEFEYTDFSNDINQLKQAVDNLEIRINKLLKAEAKKINKT